MRNQRAHDRHLVRRASVAHRRAAHRQTLDRISASALLCLPVAGGDVERVAMGATGGDVDNDKGAASGAIVGVVGVVGSGGNVDVDAVATDAPSSGTANDNDVNASADSASVESTAGAAAALDCAVDAAAAAADDDDDDAAAEGDESPPRTTVGCEPTRCSAGGAPAPRLASDEARASGRKRWPHQWR